MFGLPLAFAAPMVLTALALLPALYLLLRITPPRPRQVAFPPLRLILDLPPREETPARTPWWLLLLRLAIAALVILAMAGPIWNPLPPGEGGRGPLLLIVDDGWPAAPTWSQRVQAASERAQTAGRDGRTTGLLVMSEGGRDVLLADAGKTLERLRALKPAPFIPDRMAALPALRKFLSANKEAEIVWLSDGLENGAARAFAQGLRAAAGDNAIHALMQDKPALAIAGAENGAGALDVRVIRAKAEGSSQGLLRALDMKGVAIGDARFDLGAARDVKARFDLPMELRNEIARVEIVDEHSAGAVTLLDERWKRRRVGVVSGASADTSQPLLSPSYYLVRALTPFAEVREPRAGKADPILAMLDDGVSVLALADVGVITGPARDRLIRFVEEGGVLLRFAGTRLAASSDDLTPVRLRRGGRVLGGSLSWDTPKRLAPFERESPFYGLGISDEITVTRQVLAEPEAGLPAKTWAALADGTPLITAGRRGKGMIVLVHVTADTTWSNLPLSGLFVDLLRRTIAIASESGAGATAGDPANAAAQRIESIAPTRTLDGFGVLGAPPLSARPIPVNYAGGASAEHPPGFYGPADALTAVNALTLDAQLNPVDLTGLKLMVDPLQKAEPLDLRPALVSLALALLIADALASLWLAGAFKRGWSRPAAVGALVLLLAGFAQVAPQPAQAQTAQATTENPRDRDAALQTRLAYIVTGDGRVDEASQLGLSALSRALAARTSLAPGEPMGIDPGRDELAFYPLIYWPIVADRPLPSAEAVTRISNYMKNGGTVLFDTRDALTARSGGESSPEQLWLRKLLANVDVPELEPVPRDHVLTKTFYLLESFVGRTTIGQMWIEALPPEAERANRPVRSGDNVSPILITSNDLAGAWAVSRNGEPLYPLTPGTGRQREMALRAGVNIVIYTLTGNYKADQVHVRDLLERLAH